MSAKPTTVIPTHPKQTDPMIKNNAIVMSSATQGGSAVPKEEKKGFGKVLARVKTVLRTKRLSTSAAKTDPAATADDKGKETAKSTTKTASAAAAAKAVEPNAQKVPRAQLFEERAKKLGELYGLELKPSEWHSNDGHALRVEKPIKMRVHRKCHECGTSFGASKECSQCNHPRCKQCPRIPSKKTEAEREESRKKRAQIIKERAENAPIIPDWNPKQREKDLVLRRPAKTGAQDLVHKKPRQRVRRTCCGCKTLFTSGVKTCQSCQHVRCTDCPRDPSKKDKYPYGYPGDQPSRRQAHFECKACNNTFVSEPNVTTCPMCFNRNTERLAPKRVEPQPDPEAWKSIQAKLEAMKLK
ncbi:hypothetical protein QBC32DRAFT_222637 [Pseudoneurospora amorphoporcata]|uniref:Uncharacterized protein n=1 Tax=Pseudoneurospora amorphoporcata TaxID=241081 RepID=A0AAN6NLL9_9PEZI|nr:hypothetical protein QBC32DRAFT_222637 [Pseudoneurospora amorphoporcata]